MLNAAQLKAKEEEKKRKKGNKLLSNYVDIRNIKLNKKDPDRKNAVDIALQEMMDRNLPENIKGYTDIKKVYEQLNSMLKSSNLTINLEADEWFIGENTSETYNQMYQNGAKRSGTGQTQLRDDKLNDAKLRAIVDDKVTIDPKWEKSWDKKKRQVAAGMTFSGAKDVQDVDAKFLEGSEDGSTFTTNNKKFNPNAKQTFAALNYGRRPHGSCITYGCSYLALMEHVKEKTFYLACDTFTHSDASVKEQVNHAFLVTILPKCPVDLQDAIWNSCYCGNKLLDTDDKYLLIEAHVLKTINMKLDVDTLYLSRQKKDGSILAQEVWDKVIQNALQWCEFNGNISLVLLSAP